MTASKDSRTRPVSSTRCVLGDAESWDSSQKPSKTQGPNTTSAKDHCADGFTTFPSGLLQPPFASFVKGDYSRHRCLAMLAEECLNQGEVNCPSIICASV